MAQPPAYCGTNSTGTTTCSGHRAPCPANNFPLFFTTTGVGDLIYGSDIEQLRVNILASVNQWRTWATNNPSVGGKSYTPIATYSLTGQPIGTGDRIALDHYNTSEDRMAAANNYLFPVGVDFANQTGQARNRTYSPTLFITAQTVRYSHWQNIYTKYSWLMTDCVCNSNCSCNAVCDCHNDCGCNYSDQRLKENVEFIEQKNGINVYSWNYVWDQSTRHTGVMAQELIGTQYASALKVDRDGYFMVDYKQLPL